MSQESADLAMDTLQAEVSFQGQTIQELNEALAGQQQDLLVLRRQVALLVEQIKGLRDQAPAAPTAGDDEKPPHY